MEECEASSKFIKGGQSLSVLIIHHSNNIDSTAAANAVESRVANWHQVQSLRPVSFRSVKVSSYVALTEVFTDLDISHYNVLLVIAHGNYNGKETTICFGDENDPDSDINLGELTAAMQGKVQDKLCLFGVCKSGGDDMKTAIYEQAEALVCIAPNSDSKISTQDIVEGYGGLLIRIREFRDSDLGWDELHRDLVQEFSPALRDRLFIHPPAG